MRKITRAFFDLLISIIIESLIVTVLIKVFFMFLLGEFLQTDITFFKLLSIVFITKLIVTNFIGSITIIIKTNYNEFN